MGIGWLPAALMALCTAAGMVLPALAQDRFIVLASTTSTQDSGLFKHLLPQFKAATGIEVRVVAQGTGQALASARRGDADVVLVHDTKAEQQFIAQGFGVNRRDVMVNDFVLLGPLADPAKLRGQRSIVEALRTIALLGAPFVSRGDKSGTHAAELRLWQLAERDPAQGRGAWYRETGAGMGHTLNTANAMQAYTLADRATWISFKNRSQFGLVVESDQRLFNQYGVMLVSPAKHAHVKAGMGQAFIDWLCSPPGQAAIDAYRIEGQQLFFANANKILPSNSLVGAR